MLQLIRRLAIGIGCCVSFVPICSAQANDKTAIDQSLMPYAKPSALYRVGPHRSLHLRCEGKGTPTIILTAGLTDWVGAWSRVQPSLSRLTRTCAWDRAGFGFSDPSPYPQTPAETTKDLQRLLKAARISGPYVLVGHSAGSFETLLFADNHLSEVAAIVLLDPSIPDQSRIMRESGPKIDEYSQPDTKKQNAKIAKCRSLIRTAQLTPTSKDPENCFSYPPDMPPSVRKALRGRDAKLDQFDTAQSLVSEFSNGTSDKLVINPNRNYGSIPLIVLTAGNGLSLPDDVPPELKAELPAVNAAWMSGHDRLADLSSDGTNRVVQGSGHFVQQDKPEAVISAVKEVLAKVRARQPH